MRSYSNIFEKVSTIAVQTLGELEETLGPDSHIAGIVGIALSIGLPLFHPDWTVREKVISAYEVLEAVGESLHYNYMTWKEKREVNRFKIVSRINY